MLHWELRHSICFSDECNFYLNGRVSRYNIRYWSGASPIMLENTQYPVKLHVGAGILGIHVVGSFFSKTLWLVKATCDCWKNTLISRSLKFKSLYIYKIELHPISIHMFGFFWISIFQDDGFGRHGAI